MLYCFALTFCKLSITVQCYRIFRTSSIQLFLRIYFVILLIVGLWTILSSIFECWPIAVTWTVDGSITGNCLDKSSVAFANAGINIVTDLMLVLIPLILLKKLQIAKTQKLILLGVFGLGFFASITSIIRLSAIYQIIYASIDEQPGNPPFSITSSPFSHCLACRCMLLQC